MGYRKILEENPDLLTPWTDPSIPTTQVVDVRPPETPPQDKIKGIFPMVVGLVGKYLSGGVL